MAWSPDVIAGVTIALVLAVIGWGGTVYCWIHKKKVRQGEVSTVDKWLSKKGTTGAGLAGAHAGFAAETGIEMQRPSARRQRGGEDLERGDRGDDAASMTSTVVEGVDTMGQPRAPPPVYDGRRGDGVGRLSGHHGDRGSSEVPRYQEHA